MIVGNARINTRTPTLVIAAAAGAVTLALPLDDSLRFTLITALGWAVAAIGLDVLAGYTGQVSFGQAAFAGVGAYLAAALQLSWGVPWWLALILAVVVTAGIAALLGSITVRMPAFGFAISSLFFGYVLITALNGHQLAKWFGGPPGLAVPTYPFADNVFTLALVVSVCLLLAAWLSLNLVESRTGRALRMIKSNEAVAASCGIRVNALKVWSFTFCCGLAAIGGILYSSAVGYLAPEDFAVPQSIYIFAMVVVGGAGTIGGPILGALLVTVLPTYYLRSGSVATIVFAAILLIFLIALPGGLFGMAQGLVDRVRTRLGRAPRQRLDPRDRPTEQHIAPLAHEDVVLRGGLQVAHGVGVEDALDAGPLGQNGVQGAGEHDLVGGLPGRGEGAGELGPLTKGRVGLPHGHRLVHAAPVEVRADRRHEPGDRHEHVVIRWSPVEGPVGVLGVAVERHVRRVDQLRHIRSRAVGVAGHADIGP